MRREKKLKGGIFFYIFYMGYLFIIGVVLFLSMEYILTGSTDNRMLSKVVVILGSYIAASYKFKKSAKKVIDELLGSETEGIRSILEDVKLRKKVEKAVDRAVKFGVKAGTRKLEKLQAKTDSYDDKAVLYYIEGILYEAGGDKQSAIYNYNHALQMRPYFGLAADKLEELWGN